VLRVEDYGSDGRLLSLLVYTNIDFEPQIDGKMFAIPSSGRFKPPPERFPSPRPPRDNKVRTQESKPLSLVEAQKRSKFPILGPKYLPGGFVFEDARIVKIGRKQHIHLHYIDGLTVLSLFESEADDVNRLQKTEHHQVEEISIGGVKCKIFSLDRERILHWTTNAASKSGADLSFTLIGEISKSGMITIAESLILGE